ncbi:MAG: hypothetical protein ABJN04_03580 [Hyphomicrobiales bacterium]
MQAKLNIFSNVRPTTTRTTKPHKPFQRRQRLMCGFYLTLCLLAAVLYFWVGNPAIKAFALGLFAPGAGFLYWASSTSPLFIIALLAALVCFAAFLLSLIIWFATGNILLPPFVWLSSAFIAGIASTYFPHDTAAGSIFGVSGTIAALTLGFWGASKVRPHPVEVVPQLIKAEAKEETATKEELSLSDVQHLRLLYDRALQPIDEFNGFDWRDQFQTAAVRYQINFASYALSTVQSGYLSAFKGYLDTAQQNLAAKQQQERIWQYWKLENLWGNLKIGADPVPNANIMYTGFVAAQLAYYQAVSGNTDFDEAGSFVCASSSGERFEYSLPDFIELLTKQYKQSQFGLLACEPNWVYPLCNAITATSIKTFDNLQGTDNWNEIKHSFRKQLESEFIRNDGLLTPFRSTYTGLAIPPIGGAVMQSFPCLFLNSILPDIAERQWALFRNRLTNKNWDRAFWPIDIGNYSFSRASSYAATAAAAVEMGDLDIAERVIEKLDEACPLTLEAGVRHHENASLWANCLSIMARNGQSGMLNKITESTGTVKANNPFIKDVSYPEVLVARAVYEKDHLHAVLYPGREAGFKTMTLGGLKPQIHYELHANGTHVFQADATGEAVLNIDLKGRTEMRIFQQGGMS